MDMIKCASQHFSVDFGRTASAGNLFEDAPSPPIPSKQARPHHSNLVIMEFTIIECVAFFYNEGAKGDDDIQKNKFRWQVDSVTSKSVSKLRKHVCEFAVLDSTGIELGLGENIAIKLNRRSRFKSDYRNATESDVDWSVEGEESEKSTENDSQDSNSEKSDNEESNREEGQKEDESRVGRRDIDSDF
ncbi:hypothetical protein AWC38_SpisGene7514 [Stylophora pistillata]|uniref:Uncharacterized protein n=1 Tax=Stylophora pistillata TaxID=50429 RepID=A0A2B4SG23_STYPI|nr:hypothetical protein AWC38_SpisGene7514 [Stylophora pistillata]